MIGAHGRETGTDSDMTVINQPRGVEVTYRVTAVNIDGSGLPVVTEQVVL